MSLSLQTSTAERRPAPARARPVPARDFSAVTSADDVRRLVEQGLLQPTPLFPAALGGTGQARNLVYVPGDAAEALSRAAAAVLRRVGPRYATTVDVVPLRKGRSLVPARLLIRAGLIASANALAWTVEVW